MPARPAATPSASFYVPETPIVLICAEEPLLAALLGMLAELAGYEPLFPHAGERPEDALARTRPLLVILLDGTLDSARSDVFFSLAARRQVGVALFSGRENAPAVGAIADARGVVRFEAPLDVAEFRRVLKEAASTLWWRAGTERRGEQPRRQRAPTTDVTPDGTLVLLARGRRWLVYDRRGMERRRGDRREDGRATLAEPDRRIFVDESGRSWECTLHDGELEERSASELEGQLARATPV